MVYNLNLRSMAPWIGPQQEMARSSINLPPLHCHTNGLLHYFFSQVLQRAAIEVNEKGTEALVGTLSEIIAYSMPPIIKVDRPFHFLIYEETSRMLLFLGRVVNPTLL